jgi:hypothetical protein
MSLTRDDTDFVYDFDQYDIYTWDCTGRVIDPSPAWNWPIVLAWRTSGGMLFQVMMVREQKPDNPSRLYNEELHDLFQTTFKTENQEQLHL